MSAAYLGRSITMWDPTVSVTPNSQVYMAVMLVLLMVWN